MVRTTATVLFLALWIVQAASAQRPLLHYHFDEGGAPPTVSNVGTMLPATSPLIGFNQTGIGANGTSCLSGIGGTTAQIATPLTMTLGNNSWTIGFAIKNAVAGGVNFVFSENLATGFRAFTGGAAGAGNIRLTGTSLPTIDVIGGGGDSGWVHVVFAHDTAANVIQAYLNGNLVSTTAAASVNLTSGNALLIGRLGTSPLLSGTLIDDFRFYDYALSSNYISTWSQAALDPKAEFKKTMISEVSWVVPRGVELTHHGDFGTLLSGQTLKWISGATTVVSSPILPTLFDAGGSIVVTADPGVEPLPPTVPVFNLFPGGVPPATAAFTVALLDVAGNVLDEVRISDPAGGGTAPCAGGRFRGQVSQATGPGLLSVERIWGLDSDAGRDWTTQTARTFGRENTSDGTRGTDPLALPIVRINEIDDSPDYVELFSVSGATLDISGWFLLTSNAPGAAIVKTDLPPGTTIPAGGYVVIGNAAPPPAEMPVGVTYVVSPGLTLASTAYECALYDSLGRLIDLVRTTSLLGDNVHNFPRPPSHHSDFYGAGNRDSGGDSSMGRSSNGFDSSLGNNFFPLFTRTMGSANSNGNQAGPGGWGSVLDVRLNATPQGGGFQAIINALPAAAGRTYNFLVSATHSFGVGIFMGLGTDALVYFPTFYNVPPFSGTLNSRGSGRIDINSGGLPPGINADFIFFLQDSTGALVARTLVLEFDT